MNPRLVLTAALLLPVTTLAADLPVIVKIPRLTLEAAEKIARAAVDACRKEGIQIGVSVVDRNGDVMATLRDTMAPPSRSR